MRVLLVDGDPQTRNRLQRDLATVGAECRVSTTAAEARGFLSEKPQAPFDLLFLAAELEGSPDLALLREVREQDLTTPVIILSAHPSTEECVRALEAGADDYLGLPFEFAELYARSTAILRRQRTLPTLHLGDLHLDLSRRTITFADHTLEVSPLEFDFLRTLAERPGETFSRSELLEKVWKTTHDPGTNLVDVLVARLRRKLTRSSRSSPIDTVVGRGYRLVADSFEPATRAS